MTFESKFDIGEAVIYKEARHNISHTGTIVSVTFTIDTIQYTVRTEMMGFVHGIPESEIERRE